MDSKQRKQTGIDLSGRRSPHPNLDGTTLLRYRGATYPPLKKTIYEDELYGVSPTPSRHSRTHIQSLTVLVEQSQS